MREHELLIASLAEIESQGWDVEAYLADHQEIPAPVQAELRAAARLHRLPRPIPSTAFRTRARANFAARVSADAARRRTRWDAIRGQVGSLLRPLAAPATAAVALLFVVGGVRTASASALPGTPLYPAKLAGERVQLLLATTAEQQTQAHLSIASARLQEALAEAHQGNRSVVPSLIQSYQTQVDAAEATVAHVPSASYRQNVARAIETLGERTKDVGSTPARTNRPQASPAKGEKVGVVPSPPSSGPTPTTVTTPSDAKPRSDQSDKKGSDDGNSSTAGARANPPPSNVSVPVKDPSEQLVKELVNQALSGNVNGAVTTSGTYVAMIRSLSLDDGAINRLRGQRAQLQQALATAPPATQTAIRAAIDAIDSLLANAPGAENHDRGQEKRQPSDGGATVVQPPASVPTPTQTPVLDDHPGNNGNHGNGTGNDGGNHGSVDGNGKGH